MSRLSSPLLITLLAVLCLLTLSPAHCHDGHDHDHDHDHDDHADDSKGDVVVLDEASFDEKVSASSLSLVEFFAPWCGHCKQLAPNYAKAATALKGTALLGSVDCTVEKDLCNRFGVTGFPTLKVFRAGGDINKPTEYQGGRSEKDIVKYMKKQSEPSYIVVEDDSALESFVGKEGTEILGVFASADSAEAKAFIGAAEQLRNDYSFAISTNAAHATKYGASVPAIVLLKSENGKEESVTTSNSDNLSSADTLAAWVRAEAFPLVGEIGPENFQKYLDRELPLVWVFLDYKAAEASEKVLSEVSSAALHYKGRVSVVKLDGNRWGEHAKHFGLSGKKWPGIVAENRETNKNYVFDESAEVTAEALKTHFQGFLDGTLKPTLKSEPEPADNNGPVKVIVGTTFDKIVLDDTKDVLVEFYAPWCGHCKSLAPKYEKLGARFANEPSVVIAKVDATENDTPADIKGFPTILFYAAGDKSNPIPYEGDRTVEAMEEFVRENAKSLQGKAAQDSTEQAGHEEL